jgi:tRNA 5-methylaminomethyl-2-thiouridine biosynthesis bifunctional protein
VQLFDGALDEERFSKALDTLKWPANWVCKLTEQQIEARLGLKPSTAGLWLRQAGWCKPKRWCEALLAAVDMRHGEGMALIPGVERLFDAHVLAVLPQQQCVEIHIEQQMPTGAVQRQCVVDRVVIAAAQNSLPLFVQPLTEQKTVKGQVSILKADQRLQHVVSGASYAIALDDAHWLIGATFERPAQDCSVTQEAHQHNLAMFQNAFRASGLNEICGGRSAIRCAWPDRLPAIGPALDSQGRTQQGVWFASGFGSRGLTWAAMSAEYIRDVWTGQPSALSQDLVAAVLPGRFFSRASNSKPTLPSLPNTR